MTISADTNEITRETRANVIIRRHKRICSDIGLPAIITGEQAIKLPAVPRADRLPAIITFITDSRRPLPDDAITQPAQIRTLFIDLIIFNVGTLGLSGTLSRFETSEICWVISWGVYDIPFLQDQDFYYVTSRNVSIRLSFNSRGLACV